MNEKYIEPKSFQSIINMSRRYQKTQTPVRSCKVCKDANLPESHYTSHWVKDTNGRVTCPTLLSQTCKHCFKTGHTVKFCLKAKAEAGLTFAQMELARLAKKEVKLAHEKVALKKREEAHPKLGGTFADLAMDSDSDSDSEKVFTKGILMTPLTIKTTPSEPPAIKGPTIWDRQRQERERVREERQRAIRKGLKDGTLSWADIESSDDEYEEDVGF